MKDKEQQAELMLKSLEMMANSMDTTASLEEMAKLVADLIKFTQQNEQYLSTGFENLRSMFVQAHNELKINNNEHFATLKSRIISQIDTEISQIRTALSDISNQIKETAKRIEEVDKKEIDTESIINKTLSRVEPETTDTIAKKLNSKKNIIKQETVDGLIDRLESIEEQLKKRAKGTTIVGAATSGGRVAKIHDLSDSLDGITKTFALPAFWRVLNVYSTSTPVIFRPTVDYTTDASAMTITFTSQIDATTTLSLGQSLLVLYSEA